MASALGEATIPIRATLDKLDADLRGAKSKIKNSLDGVADIGKNVGAKIAKGIGAGLLGLGVITATALGASANSFVNFQNDMNEVFTLLPGISGEAMDEMSGQVLDFSKDFAVLPEQVVPALYQSLSAGVPKDNVFSFLEIAQMAAVGGVTDLETSVDGITSVVNAYGDEVIGAAEASDIMFTAVRLGKTDFQQLSNSLFNVIPTAASLGVGFGDISAQLATLTSQGTPTSVATTQIRASLVEASKGGTRLSNAIQELTGKSFSDLIAEGNNSVEIFEMLRGSMPEQDFKDLFGSVEALNGVLGVTGPNFESTMDAMDAMEDSTGATNDAFETMNRGVKRSLERWKAFASVALIKVGDALSPIMDRLLQIGENIMPIVEGALETFTTVLGGFVANLDEGMTPLDAFIEAIWDIAPEEVLQALVKFRDETLPGIIERLTELKDRVIELATPVIDAITGFVEWKDVLAAAAVIVASIVLPALWSLIASVVTVAAPIIALVGIIALLRKAWETDFGGIRTAVTELWEGTVKPFLEKAQQWFAVFLPVALQTLKSIWVDQIWPAISAAVTFAVELIKVGFEFVVGFIRDVIIPTAVQLWDYWVNVAWPAISEAVTNAWAVIQQIWEAVSSFVTETLIPKIREFYDKWTKEWWPEIQTVVENVWTVLKATWEEIGRWINDNLVPWAEFLRDKWVDEVWEPIQEAVKIAWDKIEPILENVREWFVTKVPEWLATLKAKWNETFEPMSSKIEPVLEFIEKLRDAAKQFWDFLSSHKFEFNISLPDLPDWAVPGSPIPLHTRWKEFGNYMRTFKVAPRIDMRNVEAAARVNLSDDTGPTKSVTYSSETVVKTNADPMRVLRASRFLDRLGESMG